MDNRIKNKLVFMLTLFLAAIVYLWYYPLNKGEISIAANVSDYSVGTIEGVIQCNQNPCISKLKTGAHSITIDKAGYSAKRVNVYVKRFKVSDVPVELEKIPKLEVSPIIPEDKKKLSLKIPDELETSKIIAPTWDTTKKKLVFLDLNDNRLKIWEKDKELKTVTTLKGIGDTFRLYWSPDQKYLFGNIENDIYFIEIESGSRKKQIIDFIPKNIIWSLENSFLLANDSQNNLHKILFAEKTVEPLQMRIDLNQAVWSDENKLMYFSYDSEENTTLIKRYDFAASEKKGILTKYSFPVSEIRMSDIKKIYFYNPDLETWYFLDY